MRSKPISEFNRKCSLLEKLYHRKPPLLLNVKASLDSSASIDSIAYKELEISSQYYDIIPLRAKGLFNKKEGLSEYEDDETE